MHNKMLCRKKYLRSHFPLSKALCLKETILKIVLLLLICLFPALSYACFSPPEGLIEKHLMQKQIYFYGAILLFIAIMVLRFLSHRNRLWVPLLLISTFTYFPAYIWHWGHFSGSCGIPEILSAFQILIAGMLVILVYEVMYFYKNKKQVRSST